MTLDHTPGRQRPGVVIPAHNAEGSIDACLASIRAEGDHDIVVVCNGCTDATAAIARSHEPAVRVIEIPDANKAGALNIGDRAVSGYPRFYVDADVVFSPGGLRALEAALARGALAASPHATVEASASPRAVRSYYAIWSRLGSVSTGLCGAGVYALSETGRARFGEFPDLIADDLFVDQRFSLDERTTVRPGVTYRAPTTNLALLQRKTRVFAGNTQLARRGPPCHPDRHPGDRWFSVLAHDPGLWPHAPAYVAITIVAKFRARFLLRGNRAGWSAR